VRGSQTEPKTPFEWARVVSFGLLALRPPVRNEAFIDDVSRLVGGKKARKRTALRRSARLPRSVVALLADVARLRAQNTQIFVICSSGGTLESATERKARHITTAHACLVFPGADLRLFQPECLHQIRAPNIPAPIFGEFGAASRSLLACHELVVKGGFTNVVHVVRPACDGGCERRSAWLG